MRKIGRNTVWQKKDAKRVAYVAMDQKAAMDQRRWRMLIRVVLVLSCLELPNK